MRFHPCVSYRGRHTFGSLRNNAFCPGCIIKGLAQDVLPTTDGQKSQNTLAYAMLEWTMAGKLPGDGYAFPLDLPLVNFYGRLPTLSQALSLMIDDPKVPDGNKRPLISKLTKREAESTLPMAPY